MDQTLTKIYIVRHGETDANIKKLYGANPDATLTDKGREQVSLLANNLKDIHFDAILSSDMIRAKQTAKIIAKERNLKVLTKKAMHERSYGKLDGKTEAEIRQEIKELYDVYVSSSDKERYFTRLTDDMETVEEAVSRFLLTLREIAVGYSGKTVLVVSHAILMRGLLVHLGHVDYHEIDSSCIDNTAYIHLDSDGIDFFIKETVGIRKKLG